MTPRDSAVAGLAEDVARALLLFAERVRSERDVAAATPIPGAAAAAAEGQARLGAVQARLVDALAAAGSTGMTTTQAAEAVGMATTNAPRALKALAERGLVVASDESPKVWRAAAHD